ncbi:response regulator transcription factor [uncultured Ezakiella sp.]|uniref:response regulator transcription factor n=1 Tax=uncultured Ezakiella sp. TaxID=1637529 RepID=UPI0025D87F11|nr:response regulator transcription factor [uncultured Ezakiella sp.]
MRILLIEDNKSLVETLKDLLESRGYEVDYYYNIDDIEDYMILNKYNLIILDLMLGKRDGLDFLKTIRNEIHRPILILTAKSSKDDQIKGLNLGADDYITKPFDADILVARINAQLRNQNKEKVVFKETEFDLNIGTISRKSEVSRLTNFELEVLKLLYTNKNKILSKAYMMSMLPTQSEEVTERTIVSHIYNIRKKILEINADDPIENKWGVGYIWKER